MYVRAYVPAYIRTWWVALRNVTRNVVAYHRYRLYVHSLTLSDTLNSDIWSPTMEMEVGDNGMVGPWW